MSYYKRGDWNAVCAICGTEYKASQLRWNSQIQDWVCKRDWEQRHPQERIRPHGDDQSVPWTRPEPVPIYLTDYYIEPDITDLVNPGYVEYGYLV